MDVSCICQTHGRPWLLAEAIESFRKQRLGPLTAELIVVNDCEQQTIICDVPGVTIINTGWIPDVSRKSNFALEHCTGKAFCFWDDDDISLPDRITDGVARMGSTYSYRPSICWHWGCGEILRMGQPLIVSAFFDTAFVKSVGGCTVGAWNDKSLWDKLWPTGNVIQCQPKPADVHYIYRWAGIGWHESGNGEQDSGKRARDFHKAALADPRFVAGEIRVEPKWKQEYVAMAERAIRQGKGGIIR